MTYYAIIVAGGTGSRMKSTVPKQFLLLNGKPVLMHTIEAFHRSHYHPSIILILNAAYFEEWGALCRQHKFTVPILLVEGGANRFESVKNGLDKITDCGIVAIHDAVRPIISDALISRAFEVAEQHGNAIPAIRSKDSIRMGGEDSSVSIDREQIFLVQTPQVFSTQVIKTAYEEGYDPSFTDDASVAERAGVRIKIIEGDQRNIKITYADDLALAAAYLGG